MGVWNVVYLRVIGCWLRYSSFCVLLEVVEFFLGEVGKIKLGSMVVFGGRLLVDGGDW